MGIDDDPELNPLPWSDLLKRERREMLVPDLLLSIGVTTLVAQSGEGKTTVAMAIKHRLETRMWGGTLIKERPVVWVIGEDIDDLRPMYEANRQHLKLPSSPSPAGFYLDGPVDLSDGRGTKKFIDLLKGMPSPLIVLDALADVIGDLDESSAKDMNRVYRNIWRVVRATGASVLVLHHAGWDEKRERGSTAIRAKSDIVAVIVDFDPEAGTVELMHKKRRGGRKLPQFFLGVELVSVAGYPEPIPIVTGPLSDLDKILDEPLDMDEQHARELVAIMVQHFPQGATYAQLYKQSGLKDSTFKRALACACKDKEWLVGGGGRGKKYNLNPNGCWKKSGSESGPTSGRVQVLYKDLDPLDPKEVRSNGPDWTQVGPLAPNTSCKNVDTTASAEKPNEIKESKSSAAKAESPDDELIKAGIGATMKPAKKPAKA